jgi:hypothetical protein
MDGNATLTQADLDREAEFDREPNDPTQAEIRAALLRLHESSRERTRHLRRQLSKWRWQAPHCPAEIARAMSECA